MGGHLASISHSSRNFLAKIREMCVKCPFWRYKRGRFGKKPRFTVKGVKVLENRLGQPTWVRIPHSPPLKKDTSGVLFLWRNKWRIRTGWE